MDVQPPPPPFVKTIEWDMMNKSKFIPLSMLSSFGVRCCFYPLTLIKTQLQVQFKNDVYNGLFDAACKIYKNEGVSGLYKGFWISSVQIFSGVFYISTYEGVRHLMTQYGSGDRAKALVAGGCASMVGQTLIVPFDVISQHAMVLGMGGAKASKSLQINPLQIATNQSRMRIAIDIAAAILKKDGIKGYYRGYTASLMAYVPNSALWWTFYHLYQGKWLPLISSFFIFLCHQIKLAVEITLFNQIKSTFIQHSFCTPFSLTLSLDNLLNVLPSNVSHLFIQCVAGGLGGFTSTIITNPLDIVRARLQVIMPFELMTHHQILKISTIYEFKSNTCFFFVSGSTP